MRSRNLGEADRIFTLYSASRGKMDAVAKGARRTKSHFAGRLEFLSEAALTLHRGRSLDVITSATIVRSEWDALVEPGAFAAASVLAEWVDAFCEPDLAQPEIYALLRGAVRAFAKTEEARSLLPRFALRLLDALGFAAHGDACVRCGAELLSEAWLDAESGGLACFACGRGRGHVIALDAGEIANFRALAAPLGAGATLAAKPAVARAVETLVTWHLGRRARSSAFLEELATTGGRPKTHAKPPA